MNSDYMDDEETTTLLKYITSISKNLYLCKYDTSSEHGILLNEKGERVTVGR